ncbi:MAG TPA: hypothetical protein VF944_08300, partial [Candidatus Bathyarchaeia archaeon]
CRSGIRSYELPTNRTNDSIRNHKKNSCRKFIVTLDEGVFDDLQHVARGRDITVQELLRAIVIPDWIERAVVE